jgi:hypothetical protein
MCIAHARVEARIATNAASDVVCRDEGDHDEETPKAARTAATPERARGRESLRHFHGGEIERARSHGEIPSKINLELARSFRSR